MKLSVPVPVTRYRSLAVAAQNGFVVVSARLVFGGDFLGVIDDEGVERGFGGCEAQAELLL